MLRRLLLRRRLTGRMDPGPPAPFVVGVGRSGTTLLRLMLDAHPNLAIPPETHFVPTVLAGARRVRLRPEDILEVLVSDRNRRWGDMGIPSDEYLERLRALRPLNGPDAVRVFYRLYAEREGKARWGDKTPDYVKRIGKIGQALPEARFVHLVRDGRDVALSQNTRLTRSGLKDPVPYGVAARRWVRQVERARRLAGRLNGRYLEVRYEDLIVDTEPTLHRICDFVELEFDSAMLEYHERAPERLAELARDLPARDGKPARPGEERLQAHALTKEPPKKDRIGTWRDGLSEREQAEFEEVAGELLSEFDYPVGTAAGSVEGQS